jgi:hypothetical protein
MGRLLPVADHATYLSEICIGIICAGSSSPRLISVAHAAAWLTR